MPLRLETKESLVGFHSAMSSKRQRDQASNPEASEDSRRSSKRFKPTPAPAPAPAPPNPPPSDLFTEDVDDLLAALNQIPAALVVIGLDWALRSIVKEEHLAKPSNCEAALFAIDSQIKCLTEAQEAQKVEAEFAILVELMILYLGSKLKHMSMIATGSRLQSSYQGFAS
jgi:hypothetical protein